MKPKRILALLLALVLCLSLCACGDTSATSQDQSQNTNALGNTDESTQGNETVKTKYAIGDEVSSDDFSFTLKEVGITDSLSLDLGTDEALPLNGGTSVGADSGKKWLCYTIEYQYIGKESISALSKSFSPVVTFDDYTFDKNYFVFDAEIGTWVWYLSSYDGTASGLPVVSHGASIYYEPLNGKTYCAKGAIQIPDAVLENTDSSIGIILEKVQFDVPIAQLTETLAGPNVENRLESFTYEDRQFFLEYVKTEGLTQMSESELAELLTDHSFGMRNNYGGDDLGNHTIHFYGNGNVDAKYTYEGTEYTMYESWKIENGVVVMQHTSTNTYGETKTRDFSFEAYRFDETRTLLLCYESDCSMVLTAS